MRQPIKKLQKTTGLVGRLFVLFTSSCDPILLSLGAASHAVGVLWNDAATGRNSCFTRVTWVRRTKRVNMFFGENDGFLIDQGQGVLVEHVASGI